MLIVDGFNNSVLSTGYLDRLHSSVSACFVRAAASATARDAIDQIIALRAALERSADCILIAEAEGDVDRAQRHGKLALLLSLEDGLPIEYNLELLTAFRKLGVVRAQLVATAQNQFGCGKDERYDGGLSKLGLEFIKEAEEVGILLDLSHLSHNSFRDAMKVARRPVIVSHCNVQGCYDHPQNLTDSELSMVRDNGGVVCITGLPYLLRDRGIEDVLDNIEYVKNTIGIAHVGLGSALMEGHPESFYSSLPSRLSLQDYGPFPWVWPQGYDSPEAFAGLPDRLAARGFDSTEIAAVMGQNLAGLIAGVLEGSSDQSGP